MSRMQRYGTHLPVLIRVLTKTKGPVLELGCGLTSTPYIFWICQEKGRKFVSYDNDAGWIKRVGYPVNFVDNWKSADIEGVHWSVALLDHRPAERRIVDAIRIKDKTDLIILHDSEPDLDQSYQYEKIYPMFKYRYDYTKFRPNTTILSNFFDPAKLFN